MKKLLLTSLFCLYILTVSAQCNINPFIQQNYELDAQILALREISNVNDPDYNSVFVPQNRVDFHLEKLSALYENPNNVIEVDSIYNEFQFHANPNYGYTQPAAYKRLSFRVNTNVSWVQALKDTGVSGITELDDLITLYQFSTINFLDLNSSGNTWFTLTTDYDFLNIRALLDDFAAIQDVSLTEAAVDPNADPLGLNYSGIPYNLTQPVIYPPGSFVQGPVAVCDIIYDVVNDRYQFYLGAGDCFNGCTINRTWYATISNDCSEVNFSTTLSTENFALTDIAIYPNPTSDKLNIQGIANLQRVEIYSILGKEIQIASNNTTIDVSNLQTGVYFLKITDDQNRSVVKKFVKE